MSADAMRSQSEVTDGQLRTLLDRLERVMLRMSPAQRERVERHVLERDPDLAPSLPTLVATIQNAKRIRMPLRRDSVS